MRKRIGSKLYDTDTADFICDSNHGKIYCKMAGSGFFIHDEANNSIIPLEYETAKTIIKDNAPKDVYEQMFSIRGKDMTKKPVMVSLSDYDKAKLRRLSSQRKMSMSEYIVWLIEQDEKRQLQQTDRG